MNPAKYNIRPGRSSLTIALRGLANSLRSFLFIRVMYPWVRKRGFLRIPWSTDLWSPRKDIEFGDKVQFGSNCVVHCDAKFGSNVLIARNVAFVGRDDHRIDLVGKTIWDSPRGDTFKTVLEDDVWVGHGSIILAGVTIGRGSVVAAGALVKDDVPRYSIVAGIPAKVVSKRFNEEQIQTHECILNYRG